MGADLLGMLCKGPERIANGTTRKRIRRRWWTVMLLYPEYLTDDYGSDIFVDSVRTASPEEAVAVVQRKAAKAQSDLSEESAADTDADDFKMVAVWPGRSELVLDAYSMVCNRPRPRSGIFTGKPQ